MPHGGTLAFAARAAPRLAAALILGAPLGALSGVLLPAHASAHLGHTVVSAERFLKLDVSEADTRLVVSLTLGAAEGRRLLAEADADGDGSVSDAEANAYLAAWAEGLRDELPVEVDGSRVEVVFGEPFLDPIGRVSAVPVTVELVAHLPVEVPQARIVVHDRMVRREIFDRTDVLFRAHDGAEIVASGLGETLTRRELDVAFGPSFQGPMPTAIALVARYPERAKGLSPRVLQRLAAAGVSLVFAVLVGLWQRRRSRSTNAKGEP